MVYLISYDLNVPAQDYTAMIGAVKALGAWKKVLKSAWLVDTANNAYQIQQYLYQFMDKSDRLFIARVPEWSGWIDVDVISWLKAHGVL